ncbi:MAG: hypothetical protein WKF57_18515 [Nakamurella sp.]
MTRKVYEVGQRRGVSPRVLLAGFETGWVESHMNNLPCGDRDSLGVFQQRPSQGWGTPAQVQNVDFAANTFFTRAIPIDRSNPGFSAVRSPRRFRSLRSPTGTTPPRARPAR